MPDFFGRMVGLMNIEANTNLLNAEAQGQQVLAQERGILVQRQQQQLQDEATTQQLLRDMSQARQGTQTHGGEVVEGDPYVSDLGKQLSREQQNAAQLRQVAQAMQGSGVSLETQRKWQKEADDAQRTVVNTEREYRQAQSDLMKHVGSIAGSAKDDDSFRSAYQQIAAMSPILTRSLTVDRDANGIPFYGPQSQRSMEMLARQGMTANEQIQREIQIKDELRKDAAEQRAQKDEQRKQQQTDSLIALRKAQGASAEKKLKDEKKSDISKAADKEPTKQMVQDSKYAVEAFRSETYPGMAGDKSMNALATDVASRANTLRAEAESRGEKISIEDARAKALASLAPRLRTTPPVTHWLDKDEPGKVSYRSSITVPPPVKKDTVPEQPKTADEYLKSIGVQ